jgi:hypothetical protein
VVKLWKIVRRDDRRPVLQPAPLLIGMVGIAILAHGAAHAGGRFPQVEIPQVQLIDEAIEQQWQDYALTPSPVAEDGKWCRRVYLDLIGRVPTFSELTKFVGDRDRDKRRKLVERLLEDSSYTDEFANHWGTIWTNILIGRSGGTERNSLTNRVGLTKYLRDSFASNKPYDQLAYELITATGSTKPGTEGFNGATNYLVGQVNDEDATLATSRTSRIFLGLQVQCTQCHNHPFNQWTQRKFWEFNAFFRQTRALRRFVDGTRDIDHAELIDQDFAGVSGRPSEAEIYYEERNGLTKVAYPVFIDGSEIDRSGYVSQVNRREELGKLILQSDYLAKMMVSRMWAHFLGYGFTKPIDDLGPHTPVSHPQLLEELAVEFRRSSYDTRGLMKWIVLSKPYQLSSKFTQGNESDDPTLGEEPQFSRFYLRQMSAEQLYHSLVGVGGQATGSLEQQQAERQRWLDQFVVAFGTDEGGEATTFNGTIPQALMMFNGDLVRRATRIGSGSWLGDWVDSNSRLSDTVHGLFMAGVARRATVDELRLAGQLVRAREGRVDEAMQDLWWAILNSNEFILIH